MVENFTGTEEEEKKAERPQSFRLDNGSREGHETEGNKQCTGDHEQHKKRQTYGYDLGSHTLLFITLILQPQACTSRLPADHPR